MDARRAGYAYVIPMPQYPPSHLGHLFSFDEQGGVQSEGCMTDCVQLRLLNEHQPQHEIVHSSIEYPSRTVALTTGCLDVEPLDAET